MSDGSRLITDKVDADCQQWQGVRMMKITANLNTAHD
jgi:hypothetical protein